MSYRLLGVPLLLGIVLFSVVYLLTREPEEATLVSEAVTVSTSTATAVATTTLPTHNLEEKVGRLFMIGHYADTPASSTLTLIEKYHLGGVVIMDAPADTDVIKTWTDMWQSATDYPLMIAIDQEGGIVQRLRGADFISTPQLAITNPEDAFSVGEARGQELAALGITMNFAPVVETSVSPQGFLYQRVFRDPEQIPELATAMLNGFAAAGVTGVIKHYPGHEDEPTDSHFELPVVELTDTDFETHTKDFNQLVSGGDIDILMTAHVLVPSIDDTYPATLSKKILTDQLRNQQNYDGIIITDDMTMDAIDGQFSTDEAAVLALEAGADLILFAAEPERAISAIGTVMTSVAEEIIDQHFARLQAFK